MPIRLVDSQENNWNQIRFRLGLRSRPTGPLGELTALPRPSTWILGVLLLMEARGEAKKGKEGEGTKRGRKGRQFPIPYATGSGKSFAASGTLGDLTCMAWRFSDLEMTWLLYCAGAATDFNKNSLSGHWGSWAPSCLRQWSGWTKARDKPLIDSTLCRRVVDMGTLHHGACHGRSECRILDIRKAYMQWRSPRDRGLGLETKILLSWS